MRIDKKEIVTRYQVSLTPAEVEKLSLHAKWRNRIGMRPTRHGRVGGDATFTKTELNQVCDVLGVNGREWFATQRIE